MVELDASELAVDSLTAWAERRWAEIARDRPDLGPAVELQRHLLAHVLSALDAMRRRSLAGIKFPQWYLAGKLQRGVPLLCGERVPVPQDLAPVLVRCCEELAKGGAAEPATHIKEALETGRIEPVSLLAASLGRDQAAIRQAGTHLGLSPDLLWLVGELGVGPFVHVLQRHVFWLDAPGEREAPFAEALGRWTAGHCPACGSWPAFAELVDQVRSLRCSFCAAGWRVDQSICIYCGESGEPFVTAAPDLERPGRRLDLCRTCGGYLKVIEMDRGTPFPLMAIEDLSTIDLDTAAMDRGFFRPPIREAG